MEKIQGLVARPKTYENEAKRTTDELFGDSDDDISDPTPPSTAKKPRRESLTHNESRSRVSISLSSQFASNSVEIDDEDSISCNQTTSGNEVASGSSVTIPKNVSYFKFLFIYIWLP